MIIEGKDFKISNDGESIYWDLQLVKIIRPRGKPEREELGDTMYGMPLEKAIKIIINYRLDKKQDVYTLQEYLHAYQDQLNLLKETLKNYGIEEKISSND